MALFRSLRAQLSISHALVHNSTERKKLQMAHAIETMSDDDIIAHCWDPNATMLSTAGVTNKVVHIEPDLVVKFGPGVTDTEFGNLQCASHLLDPAIIQVPAAYRFIDDGYIRYIVMGYVRGAHLSKKDIHLLGPVIDHLHGIRGFTPGPIAGGCLSGPMWPARIVAFDTTDDLADWLSSCLPKKDDKVDLSSQVLVLCHMDLTPRNIIVGNTLAIVDWAHAAWLPPMFEHIAYQFSPHDLGFYQQLRNYIRSLTAAEVELAAKIYRALSNSQRLYL